MNAVYTKRYIRLHAERIYPDWKNQSRKRKFLILDQKRYENMKGNMKRKTHN